MGELLFLQERMFVYQIILPYPNIFLGNLFRSIYIPQSREVSFQFHFSVYLLPIAKEEIKRLYTRCLISARSFSISLRRLNGARPSKIHSIDLVHFIFSLGHFLLQPGCVSGNASSSNHSCLHPCVRNYFGLSLEEVRLPIGVNIYKKQRKV